MQLMPKMSLFFLIGNSWGHFLISSLTYGSTVFNLLLQVDASLECVFLEVHTSSWKVCLIHFKGKDSTQYGLATKDTLNFSGDTGAGRLVAGHV